jgi:AcrR family transcriptional regulator
MALAAAGRTFLRHGYTGTSVEALSTAMEINKPSLYAAFGDKHTLFLDVLRERQRMVGERYGAAFAKGRTLEESLSNVLEESVDVVLGGEGPPGCPIASASSTESLVDEEIGAFARQFRATSDKGMARWIKTRLQEGASASAETLARLVNAVLVDLALRARVGESRPKLREIAREAATTIARAAAPPRGR